MTQVVGIIGLAGAGKDTLAGYVSEMLKWYGMKVQTFSFAWAVREIASRTGLPIYDRDMKETELVLERGWQDKFQDAIAELLGQFIDHDTQLELYSRTCIALGQKGHVSKLGRLTCSPRVFAQLLGTEGGRSISEDFWVDLLMQQIEAAAPDVALIPDTRFINEAARCDLLLPVVNRSVPSVNAHPSEHLAERMSRANIPLALLGKPRVYVQNNGTLNALRYEAARISTSLFSEPA
jgi:predicted RNA-binding protein YlxR (DUF448 family)